MSPLVWYLLGVATPVVPFGVVALTFIIPDVRARRRYIRAWKKFTAEWEAKTPQGQKGFVASVQGNFNGRYFQTGRDLYFAHRWNNGQTKEV